MNEQNADHFLYIVIYSVRNKLCDSDTTGKNHPYHQELLILDYTVKLCSKINKAFLALLLFTLDDSSKKSNAKIY